MTRSQAKAFMRRWEAIERLEPRELRSTPIEVKFRQLSTLFSAAMLLGAGEERAKGEEKVRRLWNRLKARSRG